MADPHEFVKDTLTEVLIKGSKGELLSKTDWKVMTTTIFGYPDKVARKCLDRAHRAIVEGTQ